MYAVSRSIGHWTHILQEDGGGGGGVYVCLIGGGDWASSPIPYSSSSSFLPPLFA